MDSSTKYRRDKSKGVAIIGFLLIVVILLGLVFFILTVGYIFYSDSVLRSSLEDSLQDAQGKMALWVEDPTRDPTAFNNALREVARDYESSLGQLGSSVRTLNVRPRDIDGALLPDTFRVAVLPPGFCADVPGLSQPRVCNSHLENANARTGNARTLANQQMAAGSSYQDKVRTFPTEIVAFYEVNLPFVGRIQRKVVAAGYPRLLMAQNVSTSSTSTTSTSTTSTTTTSLPTTTSTTPFTTTTTVGGGPTTTTTWIGSSTTTTAQNTTTTRGGNSTTTVPANSTTTTAAQPVCFYSVSVSAEIDCNVDCSGGVFANNVSVSVPTTNLGCTVSVPQQSYTMTINGTYAMCDNCDNFGSPCSVIVSGYQEPVPARCSTASNVMTFCGGGAPTTCDSETPRNINFSQSHTFAYTPGVYYFDANCNRVGSPGNICGAGVITQYVLYNDTPVSLLWNNKSIEDIEPKLVNFSLSGDAGDKVSLWFASADTPLLVFDPKHTGSITSASQLFGNLSFGGKPSNNGQRTPWSNGFEAMASLDLNHDGMLAGDELVDLGLWFDHNQNGVSEKGEVVTLVSAGVLELFYKSTRENSTKGHRMVYAEPGFTAMREGQKVVGNSVDWFSLSTIGSKKISSKFWSFSSFSADKKLSFPPLNENPPRRHAGEATRSVDQVAAQITGLWEWKVEGLSDELAPRGVIDLAGFDQGVLLGTTISGGAIKKNPAGIVHAAVVSELEGYLVSNSPEPIFRFRVRPKKPEREQTLTELALSKDGKELRGISRQVLTSYSGDEIVVDYRWTAHRKAK